MPVISVFGRKQEDHELEACLEYIGSSRTGWALDKIIQTLPQGKETNKQFQNKTKNLSKQITAIIIKPTKRKSSKVFSKENIHVIKLYKNAHHHQSSGKSMLITIK